MGNTVNLGWSIHCSRGSNCGGVRAKIIRTRHDSMATRQGV